MEIILFCSDPEVITLGSCSTQLRLKFTVLIIVKMPTIVGILTFMSMINTTSEGLKARKYLFFVIFVFKSNCYFILSRA